MVGRRVERVEVEPLRLHFGALGNAPAHRNEDVDDTVSQRRDWVPGTTRCAVPRQGDVDCFFDQYPCVALGEQYRLAFGERGGNGRSGLTHSPSGIGLGLW